jgi:cytochrome c biogenesis protein CcmG/thiol:disulfide interchange protein DsbE
VGNNQSRLFLRVGAGLLTLCALVILWKAGLPSGQNQASTSLKAPIIGAQVPDFQAETLDGEVFQFNDNLGHPLILNFWATWCIPCAEEMPILENLFQEGVPVVGINAGLESPEVAAVWVDQKGLTFPIVDDDDRRSLESLFRVKGLPTTFFVDQNGIIQHIVQGVLTEASLTKGLEAIRPSG